MYHQCHRNATSSSQQPIFFTLSEIAMKKYHVTFLVDYDMPLHLVNIMIHLNSNIPSLQKVSWIESMQPSSSIYGFDSTALPAHCMGVLVLLIIDSISSHQ